MTDRIPDSLHDEVCSTTTPPSESIYEFANRMGIRHQNRNRGHSKPKVIGTSLEEAAWQILKPFINPLDCNHYVNLSLPDGNKLDDVYCMNTNETLNRVLNGEAVSSLKHFSKNYFITHCRGQRPYYYRCRSNARFSTGYGNGNRSHLKLPFAGSLFGMDHKRMIDQNLGIVLLGGDIDCHHNEKDVKETTDLLLRLFPNAYTEASTNGKGCHIYLKLTYPLNRYGDWIQTIEHLHLIVDLVSEIIEKKRIHCGYDAPFDKFRGLPSLIHRDEQNHRLSILKRSQVIKIPFYRDCSLERVLQFHHSPWYCLHDLENLILASDVGNDDVVDVGIYDNSEENRGSVDNSTDKGIGVKENINFLSSLLPNRAYPAVRPTSEIQVTDLMDIEDSRKRRLEFGLKLVRHLGRVPSPQELKAEYVKSGLFKASSKSDNDDHRYAQLVQLLAQSFNPQKVEFHYRDYPTHKNSLESLVKSKTVGARLEWKKDKVKPIRIDKLAALYWAIRHSQGKKDFTRFSYRHVVTALKATIGQSAHRNEIARMLAILEEIGLIVRVAKPVWGAIRLGQGWRATV